VFIETPVEGQTVAATVPLRVLASSGGAAVSELVLEAPTGLVDLDPDPARFEANWDTRQVPEGPFEIRARATTSSGATVTATRNVTVVRAEGSSLSGVASLGR